MLCVGFAVRRDAAAAFVVVVTLYLCSYFKLESVHSVRASDGVREREKERLGVIRSREAGISKT